MPSGSRARMPCTSATTPAWKPSGTSCTIPKSTKQSSKAPPRPGSDEQIAGVRIAVEEAVREDLRRVRAEQRVEHLRAVDARALEPRAIGHADAGQVLGHEHARARELRHDVGDAHARVAREVRAPCAPRSRPRAGSRARARARARAGRAGARSRAYPRCSGSRAPRAAACRGPRAARRARRGAAP